MHFVDPYLLAGNLSRPTSPGSTGCAAVESIPSHPDLRLIWILRIVGSSRVYHSDHPPNAAGESGSSVKIGWVTKHRLLVLLLGAGTHHKKPRVGEELVVPREKAFARNDRISLEYSCVVLAH